MPKVIVSDLDGTLLPPSKIMPAEIFPLIEKMHARGITFVPASGRQLPNLKKLFAPALGRIAIIAENGGLAWLGGRIIYCNPTHKVVLRWSHRNRLFSGIISSFETGIKDVGEVL